MQKNYKSQFEKQIRITKKPLDWIKRNKNTKTRAGFLAKIIEYYIESQEIMNESQPIGIKINDSVLGEKYISLIKEMEKAANTDY